MTYYPFSTNPHAQRMQHMTVKTAVVYMMLLAVVMMAVPFSHAQHVLISFTRAPTFSGSLPYCAQQPNSTSCIWGLPAALAKHRLLVSATNSTSDLFIPDMDTRSAFVNIHPEKAGLNIKLYKSFNISHYVSEPWLVTDLGHGTPFEPFLTTDVTPLMTTRDVLETHQLQPYLHRYLLLHYGHIAVLDVGYSETSFVTNLLPRLQNTIQYLRRIGVHVIVLLCDDSVRNADWYINSLGDAHAVDVAVDLLATTDTPCTPVTPTTHNTTKRVVICGASSTRGGMILVSLLINTYVDNETTFASELFVDSAASLNTNETDELYMYHKNVVYNELLTAIAEDAVVGSTSIEVPAAYNAVDPANTYPCFTGECAFGTLLARSYLHYYPEADIAMFSAGSFIGGAWPAGNITTSQIWSAFPFPSSFCVGRITGMKVFKIIDVTLEAATFVPDPSGYRLLHLGNAEIEINSNLTSHRLIGLKIRNNNTGVYEPLDRLRYYNFVTNNYHCELSPLTSSLFNTLLEGETKTVLEGTLIQESVSTYLRSHTPYDATQPLTTGYMRFVSNPSALSWSSEATVCGSSEFWNEDFTSCAPCPSGQTGAGTTCIDTPDDNSHNDLIWQIGAPIVAVVLICIAVVATLEWRRRRGTRVTINAPRSGNVAIIFTDIQASTRLWGAAPASMAAALGKHNAVIRKEIAHYGGYEVKTVGDSFMIAMSSAQDAVEMAVAIQTSLHRQSWPRAIDNVYNATTDKLLAAVDDDVDDEWIPELEKVVEQADSSQPGFRGIRIRIGAHFGPADVEFDTVAKGYDYHGPNVNIAARVEGEGLGGQIIITQKMASFLKSNNPILPYTIAPRVAVDLRGVAGKTDICEVVPTQLPHREFYTNITNIDINTPTATSRQDNASRSFSAAMGFSGRSTGATATSGMAMPQADGHSSTGTSISPEQELAFKCLDVYMSVVPKLDREAMLKTLGRAWGLERRALSTDRETLELLAFRAGHRLRRVLNQSYTRRDLRDNNDQSLRCGGSIREIRNMLASANNNHNGGNIASSSFSPTTQELVSKDEHSVLSLMRGNNASYPTDVSEGEGGGFSSDNVLFSPASGSAILREGSLTNKDSVLLTGGLTTGADGKTTTTGSDSIPAPQFHNNNAHYSAADGVGDAFDSSLPPLATVPVAGIHSVESHASVSSSVAAASTSTKTTDINIKGQQQQQLPSTAANSTSSSLLVPCYSTATVDSTKMDQSRRHTKKYDDNSMKSNNKRNHSLDPCSTHF